MQKYENDGSFLFNMFFVENKKGGRWGPPKSFTKGLTTKFNNGYATFNNEITTIFFQFGYAGRARGV